MLIAAAVLNGDSKCGLNGMAGELVSIVHAESVGQ